MSDTSSLMPYDKRSCVKRALQLLAAPTPEGVRYAALELRTCMELLTYEKLRSFTDYVPESVLRTWQPPQAVKTLLEFDETADQSFTIEIGVETAYGEMPNEMQLFGEHKALPLKWLRKNYNKVGALLHAPIDHQGPFLIEQHSAYLRSVLAVLEEAANSSILGGRFTDTYRFLCSQCGKPVVRNRAAVQAGKTALCFTVGCDAEYRATSITEDNASFVPVVTRFKCAKCEAEVNISDRKLQLGVGFACPSCGQKHGVVGHQWIYAVDES